MWSTVLKSESRPTERVSRCCKLMVDNPPGFNDRWPYKRALSMHKPSNISVLFPLEMKESTEEFEKISDEEEDGCVVSLRAGIKSFIKRHENDANLNSYF